MKSESKTKKSQGQTPTKKKETLSLIQNIEMIVKLSKRSELNEEFFKDAKKYISVVSKTLNLSPVQAVILSVFMNFINDGYVMPHNVLRYLDCSILKWFGYIEDIEALEKKKYIRVKNGGSMDGQSYRVPSDVIKSILKGEEYKPTIKSNLDFYEVLQNINYNLINLENKEITNEGFEDEAMDLFINNRHLNYSNKMIALKKIIHNVSDYNLLILFCHLFINDNDDCVGEHDYQEYFSIKEHNYLKRSLKTKTNSLFTFGYIENTDERGFLDPNYFKLTNKTKEDLFSDIDIFIDSKTKTKDKDIIVADSIIKKDLFYNDREKTQIEELSSLLDIDNFKNVQKRLSDKGMRSGFACLFYGSPGTGKTETVYQLAKATGRDIMIVDISATKSMWFGESEKIIKQIFSSYKSLVKNSEIAPILLFNEADAVIGKRKEMGEGKGNVQQTENAIQNIILQEMEELNGIMIATSNLTKNLDNAFERRFLYKIEFDKPCLKAKQSIWMSMLKGIKPKQAAILAESYDFSGGQIENITRKHVIEELISGKKLSIDDIKNLCDVELIDRKPIRNKIGFK
ncbi:MAG: AAA family ATPase [Bacteroidales bacterium]